MKLIEVDPDVACCNQPSPAVKVLGFNEGPFHGGCPCLIAAGVDHEWHCCFHAMRWPNKGGHQ